MATLTRNLLWRRLITVSTVILTFVLLTVLLPLVLTVALFVDLVRWTASRTPAVASRGMVFAWIYLLGEVWAVIALALVASLGRERSIELTYRLQGAWATWNVSALRLIFMMRFSIGGLTEPPPTPFAVLARHASLIDSLLPATIISRGWGVRLRYVLKKELLMDPALDIAGNRLPNYFVDRSAPSDFEAREIRRLANEMPDDQAVVIFPEGTRYSEEKSEGLRVRYSRREDVLSRIALSYRRVLPPRPAGTLALLDQISGDVIVLVHRGLEGLASMADIWSGKMVGRLVTAETWLIPGSALPTGRTERIEWLFRVWSEVDGWVVGESG